LSDPRVVRFYLPKEVREGIAQRRRPFFNLFVEALEEKSFRVQICSDELNELAKALVRPGYSVFLMQEPVTNLGVSVRKNYFYPFWNIQKSAKRWEWPVARMRFPIETISQDDATTFFNYWRRRQFGNATRAPTKEGFVFVPLQGKLLTRRSFQSCSPIEMVEHVLRYDKYRPVVASLHPKENYNVKELMSLRELLAQNPRLHVTSGNTPEHLRTCDYVATQNSGVAFSGYFFQKPAVLFGKTDFHHIAASVFDVGPEKAIRIAPASNPPFAKYLLWFLKERSIHVQLPGAKEKIIEALFQAGWPVRPTDG